MCWHRQQQSNDQKVLTLHLGSYLVALLEYVVKIINQVFSSQSLSCGNNPLQCLSYQEFVSNVCHFREALGSRRYEFHNKGNLFLFFLVTRPDKEEFELKYSFPTYNSRTRTSQSHACGFTATVFAFPGRQYLTTRSWRST